MHKDRESKKTCYLCGSRDNLTRDHLAPQSFFVKPRPTNLITVPCCKNHNEGFSLVDDSFRAFVSSLIGRSTEGKAIWDDRVMKSTFKRSPKLKSEFRERLSWQFVGKRELLALGYPESDGRTFLTRLTKGILYHYHPSADQSSIELTINMVWPTRSLIKDLNGLLFYDQRGRSEFRFWRGFISDKSPTSLWVYLFYDCAMFKVDVYTTVSRHLFE